MDYLPKPKQQINSKERANFLSQLFFLYTLKLFVQGYRKDLDERDLYQVPTTLRSRFLGDQYEKAWSEQQAKRLKPSLVRLLLKCHGLYYFFLGLSQLVLKTTFIALYPFLIDKFSSQLVHQQINTTNLCLWGLSLVALVLLESLYDQWYILLLSTLEIRVRVGLSSLIYRKTLRLSLTQVTSIGKTVTLITKDLYNLCTFIDKANDIWISTIQAIILFFTLYQEIGFVVLVPIVFSAILVPLQTCLGVKSASIKTKMFEKADSRLETTRDILGAIRTIKMSNWRNFFTSRVTNLRMGEVKLTYTIFLLKFIMFTNATLWTCITFFPWMAAFVALEKPISTEIVYFMFATYRTLSYLLGVVIPFAACNAAQVSATLKRLDEFLTGEETQQFGQPFSTRIFLEEVTVTLKKNTILKHLNLNLKSDFVLIGGAVGSGKTVLLKTILGEFPVGRGNVVTQGSISYASQEPWLFPATIRQNIVFGERFDEKRYNKVLKVCGLIYDLQLLQDGDESIVEGGQGVTLSQGQRSCVNLARAIYKDSDIYLLDDCLASLDWLTSCYIFDQLRQFLHNKLVLVVTQDVRFSEKCPNVVVLIDNEISSSGFKPVEINRQFAIDHSTGLLATEEKIVIEENESDELLPTLRTKNIFQETHKKGPVEYRIYGKWSQTGGGVIWLILVTSMVAFLPVMVTYVDDSISSWVSNEEKIANYTRTNLTELPQFGELLNKRKHVVTVHIVIILVVLLLTITSSILFLHFCKQTSLKLHELLVKAVTNAPIQCLDKLFVGHVFNRFSSDLLNVDEVIPFLFYDFARLLFSLVGTVVVVIAVKKIFLVSTILLVLTVLFLKNYYLPVGRSLKRLETSTKAPILSYFDATLAGQTTIRAQRCEKTVRDEFDQHQDLNTSASFMLLSCTRTFCLSLGVASVMFFATVISSFFGANDAQSASPTLYKTVLLIQVLSFVVSKWAELETHMTSVERVLVHADIKQESGQGIVLKNWSKVEEIKFENVELWYSKLNEPVLKNVSFVVRPREKIGIVGRTGAGKSSLVSALFRLCDFDGKIFVNGVDIKTLSLEFLRASISVVPQDFVLFSGTIRENVDPFQAHSDTEICKVLDSVNLHRFIYDLDKNICSSDSPFSTGQKQLICLARVILAKNDIVVVDAGQRLDKKTENSMNDTVWGTFADRTVLIVSQNPQTLLRCDKVLVLDNGRITEFDPPQNILKNKNGEFYRMVAATNLQA